MARAQAGSCPWADGAHVEVPAQKRAKRPLDATLRAT